MSDADLIRSVDADLIRSVDADLIRSVDAEPIFLGAQFIYLCSNEDRLFRFTCFTQDRELNVPFFKWRCGGRRQLCAPGPTYLKGIEPCSLPRTLHALTNIPEIIIPATFSLPNISRLDRGTGSDGQDRSEGLYCLPP
ncbi:hypothetical protein B296_00031453 [Ensete ventricosum]|uniref:Uncharacterized protein n=1 Tax=Ensete ventricosum TaxID=4639 RepID=A0A426XSJ8_ENSVE|nr:hypothetical protein B296_00031453 [Ensete ventricosum]